MYAVEQLKKKIKAHADPKVVGLAGDPLFIDDSLEFLRTEIISPNDCGLNHHRLIVGEDELNDISLSLYSMPFLAEWRLFELCAAEKLNAQELSVIMDYLILPCSSSWLVFIFDKLDKKNKLVSYLDKQGLLYSFDSTDSERTSYIIEEARALGLSVDQNVAQFLDAAVCHDLLQIKNSLKKLSLLFKNQQLSIDDVEKNVVEQKDFDVFLLARTICEGQLKESLYTLGLLRNSNESAIKFLGILMWQFRTLVHIRHCFDRGMSEWDTRKQVAVYGDRFMWMAKIATKRTIAFHVSRLTMLLQCDAALKTDNRKESFNFIEKVVYQSAIGLQN